LSFLFPGQSVTSSGTLVPTPSPGAPLAPPPPPPQTATSTSGSSGSRASSISPDDFVALIVTSSGLLWTEDDDDDMPSISKELQDIDKLNKDGSNWRIFEARILIGAKALNIDEYLTSEPTDPTNDADKLATHKATRGQLLNAIVQKLPSDVFIRHVKDDTPHKLWTAASAQ
jgi:hypothetical protein